MTVQIPFERNDWIFHTGPWFLPFCASVDVSKYLDILTLDFLNNVDASSILTWVSADTASAACPEHPGSRDSHLGYWWSLFSEHCIRTRIIFYNVTSEYHPAFVLSILVFQLRILNMTEIHQCRKMNFSSLIPCFIDHLIIVSDVRQLPCRTFLQFFPLFLHSLPLHLESRHRNEFVYWIVVTYWIHPFSCNVIFITPVRSSFQSNSHGFVSFKNKSTFCLVSSNSAASFPATSAQWSFAKHCCWHRNFQLSTSILHCILKFLVFRINEVNTTLISVMIELWFLDSPLLFFLTFWCIRHTFSHFWP